MHVRLMLHMLIIIHMDQLIQLYWPLLRKEKSIHLALKKLLENKSKKEIDETHIKNGSILKNHWASFLTDKQINKHYVDNTLK